MSLLEGDPKSALPSMSWDSVVADGVTTDQTAAPADSPDPAPGLVTLALTPPPAATASAPETLAMPRPAFDVLSADVTGSTSAGAPPPVGASPASEPDSIFSTVRLTVPGTASAAINTSLGAPLMPVADHAPTTPAITDAVDHEQLTDLMEPDTASAPPVTEPSSTDASIAAPAVSPETVERGVAAPFAEPTVASAPPVPPVESAPASVVAAEPVPLPMLAPQSTAPAHTVASSGPLDVDLEVGGPPPRSSRRSRKARKQTAKPGVAKQNVKLQKSGGPGLGLLLVLVVLAALIAAGIVFGRPYLFPDDWDVNAKPYAENVEEIRGVEYTEPLMVVAEPTADYRDRVGDQLLGPWETDSTMWRAFGLAAGGTTRDVLDGLITDRSPALYSTTDGQVYHDASLAEIDLDPQITRAMAVAAIDQEFRWTSRHSRRSLLDAALVDAHVSQQATAIQQQSAAPTAIRPTDDAPLSFLPPVIDYRLFAPVVFEQVLMPFEDIGVNPLVKSTVDGSGPIAADALQPASAAIIEPDDQVAGTPRTMDRGFWYLALATHLDAGTAHRIVNELGSASIVETTSSDGPCFYATFAPSDANGNESLAADLGTWAQNTAAELRASTSRLADGGTQLRTCDPGAEFTSNARFGVARELIAWEAAELATVVAISAAGGDQASLDNGLAALAASDLPARLIGLGPGAPASDIARVAREGAAEIAAQVVSNTVAAPSAADPAVVEN